MSVLSASEEESAAKVTAAAARVLRATIMILSPNKRSRSVFYHTPLLKEWYAEQEKMK